VIYFVEDYYILLQYKLKNMCVGVTSEEKFEDIKGIIRGRLSKKDSQHNDQK